MSQLLWKILGGVRNYLSAAVLDCHDYLVS
jgi:hypothetical protein